MPENDVAVLQAELARLRAENEALKSGPEPGRARTRWGLAAAITAALVLTLAVPSVWLNRVVMSTDAWVATVAPLASDPAIQDVVARSASDAIIAQLNTQERLESALPTALAPFAPVLASSVDGFVRQQATAIVRSDQFAQLWTELNRRGHTLIVGSLTGERDGAVSIEAGSVQLDVGLVAEQVKQGLVDRGLTFVSALPTDRLDTTVEVFSSPALAQAQGALAALNSVAFWMPLVGLGLVGIAFGVAQDRRRVALWLGVGIVLAGLVPLQAIYLSQYWVVGQAQQLAQLPGTAAQNAYQIIFGDLIRAEQTLTFLGIIVWVAAVVAGPSKWAVALRGATQGGLTSVGSHLELGAFGSWVALRKRGLRAGGFIAAVLLLLALPAPRSMASIAWIAAAVVVWLVALEILGAGGSALSVVEDGSDEPVVAGGAVADVSADGAENTAGAESPEAGAKPVQKASADEAVESGEEDTSS